MYRFHGEYEVTLDAKGRFLLPSGFKKQLPENESIEFFLNRGIEKCLTLYPAKVWEAIYDKVMTRNYFDGEDRLFQRRFLNGVTKMELDTAGRMLIPSSLKEYAGLEKDIVLVTMGDRMEIWDKAKHQQFLESLEADDAAFSALAQKVMGNKDAGQ
jgi:MraZ protein